MGSPKMMQPHVFPHDMGVPLAVLRSWWVGAPGVPGRLNRAPWGLAMAPDRTSSFRTAA